MDTSFSEALGFDTEGQEYTDALDNARQYADIIDTLVTAREDQHLSQIEVGRRMGTTQSAVSRLESLGGDARLSTIQRYANAIGMKLHIWAATRTEVAPLPAPATAAYPGTAWESFGATA